MKLMPIAPEKLIRALERAGFEKIRQRGSHVFLKHPDGRATVVPVHKGEDIGRGLLRKIMRDAKLTEKNLWSLLKGDKSSLHLLELNRNEINMNVIKFPN
jgi:predicted RNA binding protein YcfA (HicA-like mRNA interferase family)